MQLDKDSLFKSSLVDQDVVPKRQKSMVHFFGIISIGT